MAVVSLSTAGEPTLALPNIALALGLLDYVHPPVDAEEYCDTNDPLDGQQQQVDPTKQDEPQATILALNVGQLDVCAAALGTFLIQCHKKLPLLSFLRSNSKNYNKTIVYKSQVKKRHAMIMRCVKK